MLTKLLKYEFKATGRVFLISYAALLAVAVLSGFSTRFSLHKSLSGLFFLATNLPSTLYACLLFAVAVLTVVTVILRFSRNLLGGEGYLMHTLPVPTWMHVASKLIVAAVWSILSMAAAMASSLLLALASGFLDLSKVDWLELFSLFSYLPQVQAEEWATIGLLFADCLFGGLFLILLVYLCIMVGRLAPKFRSLLSVVLVIAVFNVVVNVLLRMAVQIDLFNAALAAALGLLLALDAACFVGTTLLLKYRLNLELSLIHI